MPKYDIITVGSATIDIFVDTGNKLFGRKIPFGEKILLENFRLESGGGAINTAVAFSRMEFRVGCLTKIGQGSDRIIESLERARVDTSLIVRDNNLPTDHSIILDAIGKDRTILVYKSASSSLAWPEIDKSRLRTDWFYLATMPVKFLEGFLDLGAKIALNTSQYLAEQKPKKILRKTDILIVNKEEAGLLISKNFQFLILDFEKIHKLGPKIIVVTDKDNEAQASDGNRIYKITPHKNVKCLERTGAGDAFASGFVSGIMHQGAYPAGLETALKIALANSESVISHYGAQNKLLSWAEAKAITGI